MNARTASTGEPLQARSATPTSTPRRRTGWGYTWSRTCYSGPRGSYAQQRAHNASKIRPGPGMPPGYIVLIAAALTAVTTPSVVPCLPQRSANPEESRHEKFNLPWQRRPACLVDRDGWGGGAEGRTQRARWSLMEPYGALRPSSRTHGVRSRSLMVCR